MFHPNTSHHYLATFYFIHHYPETFINQSATHCCVDGDRFTCQKAEKYLNTLLPCFFPEHLPSFLYMYIYIYDQQYYLTSPTNSVLNAMELKSTITTVFFLFLLLSLPYFSTGLYLSPSLSLDLSLSLSLSTWLMGTFVMIGGSEVDLEVYQIDYRGPETHSSTPPPDHAHGKPLIHRKSSLAPRKSKGSRGTGTIGEKVSLSLLWGFK
jgi:hypothetical protein